MKKYRELKIGYIDAVNYQRQENKEFFNKIFLKANFLDQICNPNIYFVIGEKGTGKTAYSTYIKNNRYKNNAADTRFIRETEYTKFMKMKCLNQLDLSDFESIWKVIIYVLLFDQLTKTAGLINKVKNINQFNALKETVEEFYAGAFSPEIINAISFAEDSKVSAEIMFKHFKLQGVENNTFTFSESRYQINLLYLQRKFESVFKNIRLDNNQILFIDGIDIRPANIPFNDYLDCIKGLANAVWALNNDIFSKAKDAKGRRIRVVLLLRPDIFSALNLQNQNTKLLDNSVFLDWRIEYISYRESEIFKIFDNLLANQQENSADLKFGEAWSHYFPWDASNYYETLYLKPTSFINFLRWSYYRPRDILEMLILLQKHAKNDDVVTLKDFENPAFKRDYSDYLLGEIKDHLLFYYSSDEYNIFLKFFEYLEGHTKFNYEAYLLAFSRLEEYIQTLKIDNLPKFMNTPNDFLQFLFDLNVICYVERTEENKPFIHWCFKDRTYGNIAPQIKSDVEYQVFYGLLKSLNLGKKLVKSN